MARLLILLVLGWVIYYSLRGLFSGEWARGARRGRREEGVDDVMHPCPECGTYFPSASGVSRRVRGQRLLFCEAKCAEEYARRGGPPPG